VIETLGSLMRHAGHALHAETRDISSVGSFADARIGSSLYNLLSQGAGTYSGRPVSPNTALSYVPIYACVAKIAKSVASCPLITYRNTGPNSDTKTPAVDDYRYRMLKEQPNPEMTSFNWREAAVVHLLLWGNHYSYLQRDGAGRIIAIWPLEPSYVQVLRTRAGGKLVYRYFPHNPYSVPVKPGVYLSWEILHIPYLGFDGVMGFSPITLARQAIALGLDAEEYLGRFYGNGGKPPYWIEYEGQINDREKFMEKFRETTGAMMNAGKPFFGYGGLKLHEMKMSPEDAQYVEGSNLSIAQACRLYDMPLSMMGDPGGKASTYASSEQEDIKYAKHTVAPICERVEKKVDITILGSNDALTSMHDMRRLYRGDMLTVAKTHQAEIASGEISPNEARAESGRNPGPAELDEHFIQGAMATVKHVVANGFGGGKAISSTEEEPVKRQGATNEG
jgi:HK97 family phage portal protein